jgi:peptidoglycan/xylan/chitin deacetylase (PgdA/CDA1 family)
MLSRLRKLVAGAIRWSGMAALVRHTWGRRRVAILMYHDPSPELLERHLAWLAPRYGLTTLSTVVDALRSGDWSRVPPRPLVLTIDDGHAGNLRLLEVLRRHEAAPAIFLCSRIVATRRRFWFLGVDAPTAGRLKHLPNRERLAVLERETGFRQADEDDSADPEALSAADLERLGAVCEFGAHTRFHPILPRCTDAEAEAEIAGSKADLEELLGSAVRHFAYPNGLYGERELDLVRRAGFDSARTTDVGWVGRRTDPHRLPILSVPEDASLTDLAAELAGLKRLVRLLSGEGTLRGHFRLPQ